MIYLHETASMPGKGPDAAGFSPAPYMTGSTAGWSFLCRDGAVPETDFSLSGGKLTLKYGGAEIELSDTIHSGWLHAGNGGNLNPALLTRDGDYDLFNADSSAEKINENVIRVRTPLKDNETGAALGAAAYTDLIIGQSLVVVMTYFDADAYTPVRQLMLCRAAVKSGKACASYGGYWHTITEEPQTFADAFLVCRDLREFDIRHPVISYIAPYETELPEVESTSEHDGSETVKSGDMTVYLRRKDSGVSLLKISDDRNEAGYEGPAEPLFRLIIRRLDTGTDEMLTSESGWESVTRLVSASGVRYIFDREGVSAELTAVTDAGISQISWEADVRLRDRNLTAVRFDPPAARMNIGGDTRVFFALGPGQDIPVSRYTEMHSISPYPSIGVCMQYLALYHSGVRRGLYCGFHDPHGSYKMLIADCHNGIASAHALIPASGIDEPMNGFRMEGRTVWRLFDGDWYDAALIYRDWVYKCSSWFTGIKAKDRSDVPKWLLDTPYWFRSDVNHDGWMDNLFRAYDDIGGIPAGVHAYQWHQIPFDTNYPHYKPAREDFVSKIPVMQAHGIKVMPYINGRLWDTHDRGDYDYQFTSVAKPYAAKGRNGEIITEHYASKNSRGEPVELAVMCPSSALWQEKQSEINGWILNDLGCDAVYVDQIAAAPPVTCMDKTHSHRPGGGYWWFEHYYNLIDHLNLVSGADKCYTTESNAEPFAGHIGGMLVWHWVGSHQVPAFPVIYAGYQPMLGRNYGVIKPDDALSFRVLTAQSLCFGDQPGWMTPELYLANPSKDFFRLIVSKRREYSEYFTSGTCLRPPELSGNVGKASLPFASDAVISAMWENESGDRIVIVVNISGEERNVTVSPEGAPAFELRLPSSSVEIREIKK